MKSERSLSALVAGDRPGTVQTIAVALEALGVGTIDYGRNGAAALAMLRERPYNLVISDWSMEPVSGLQLLKFLRADPRFAEVRFIMMTTKPDPSARRIAIEAGANGCLTDTVSPAELERELEDML